LVFSDHRLQEARDVLLDRAAAAGGPAAYAMRLAHPAAGPDELAELARRLTVGETYFFRHDEQVRALLGHALPELARRGRPDAPLRILSAGCATGEEPYTLAIALREQPVTLRPVEITGTDLNRESLATAQAALFSRWSLRSTPDAIRSRWFRAELDRF